jgi:hypothetical protein
MKFDKTAFPLTYIHHAPNESRTWLNDPLDGDAGNTNGAVATPVCVVTIYEVLLLPRLTVRTE